MIYSDHVLSGQDYAWIKGGMIFPFVDYVDRCLYIGLFYFSFLCYLKCEV